MPIRVKRGLFSPRRDFRSSKGRIKRVNIPAVINKMAMVSPFKLRISPGKNFKVWKRKRKYHTGLIFSGVGARGSLNPVTLDKKNIKTIKKTVASGRIET